MKLFFMILFFGKEILLTSSPVDITNEWLILNLEKQISAINSGATLNVQLSPNDPIMSKLQTLDDPFDGLVKNFPNETIEAILIDTNNDEVKFQSGSFSISDFTFQRSDSVRIKLLDRTGVLLNRKFKTLKIKSEIPLENVK
ncbi:MAG: hypothetical protein KKA76_06640, partial [Proteobacteria bacterium]|nr:hypothetical protein [Pseudomonadota bacterium]